MSVLHIRLLGGLDLEQDRQQVTGFVSNKGPALLAYLAVTRRAHQRDALAGLLWGELPDADARNNLRQALSNLRKLLEPFLLITRETVQFDPASPHLLDCAHFEAALRASRDGSPAARTAALQQAADLYQGDFLAGFFVRDAPDYEEWMLGQRLRYRELALYALHTLTEEYLACGDYGQAIDGATRLLALDPWREEAHRQLMTALARSGRRSAALAQFDACRQLLERELGVPPSAETTALDARIRAGHRRNLPAPSTPLIGRTDMLAALSARLRDPTCRLLTLTGLGGIGKTRLALAAAAEADVFLNGACFVSLDAVSQTAFLPAAIADALQLPPAGHDDPRRQLLDYLREKELLLVLDNFEHLLDGAGLLSDILAAAADVKLLVTSRERLNLRDEMVFAVGGLAYPDAWLDDVDAQLEEDDAHFAAVTLFAERARRADRSFTLTSAGHRHVVRICQLLHGLPLGIELAAAWVHLLPCAEIAQAIDQTLGFLETPLRDVAERHRSLRAAFEHSWRLLSAEERRTFRQLSVFQGGFRREAAQQVTGTTLRVLTSLVEKSLLILLENGRYERHPLLWQFGAEKLDEVPDERAAAEASHAACYAAMLETQSVRLAGGGQQAALALLDADLENIRLAWQRMLTPPAPQQLARAIDGIYHYTIIRSRFREGLEMFQSARLALEPVARNDPAISLVYGRVMAREGRFQASLAQYVVARMLLQQSLATLRQLDARAEVAFVLGHLGGTARLQGDLAAAEACLQECLALRQALADDAGQAVALLELAGVAFTAEQYAMAATRCQEGLVYAERAGDVQTTAHLLTGLSLILREMGQFEMAQAYGQRSLALYEELDDRYGLLQGSLTLGELSRRLHNDQEAEAFFGRAVHIAREIGDRSGEADGMYRLGQMAADAGQVEEARHRLLAALHLANEIQEIPLLLDILLAFAGLLVQQGAVEPAARMLAALLAQPQLAEQRRQRATTALVALGEAGVETTYAAMDLAELVRVAQTH